MLQGSLISKPSKVHTRGDGDKGRGMVPKRPSQGCGHFSQLLDGKLP